MVVNFPITSCKGSWGKPSCMRAVGAHGLQQVMPTVPEITVLPQLEVHTEDHYANNPRSTTSSRRQKRHRRARRHGIRSTLININIDIMNINNININNNNIVNINNIILIIIPLLILIISILILLCRLQRVIVHAAPALVVHDVSRAAVMMFFILLSGRWMPLSSAVLLPLTMSLL